LPFGSGVPRSAGKPWLMADGVSRVVPTRDFRPPSASAASLAPAALAA
jgi:hypothetical protein